MRLSARLLGALIISGIRALVDAHGGGQYHHHRDRNDIDTDMNHKQNPGNLRSLGIFDNDNVAESLFSNQPCKDGEPTFTVGNVTYLCKADFHRKGGVCGTSAMSSDRRAKSDEHFEAWMHLKDDNFFKWHGHLNDVGEETRRSLGGCVNCVDWSSTIITVPTYVHVIHSGTTGKQFTYTSNPSYIRNQIKAMNSGFRGTANTAFTPYPGRSYPRYNAMDSDTRIQFCIAGTTATDNPSWYNANDDYAMKTALKKGGSESLNVYVSTVGGMFGYAYFPESQDFIEDGVVILNDSMPGGALVGYNEGDTLTHEVGHWLGLEHTHGSGCAGPGDYMDLAPPSTNYASVKSCESAPSYGCPTSLNNCASDGGNNPIHNFMSYSDDNCMDQFTPGQKMKLQQAWETYRHKSGYSELISLAADGYSCVGPGMPTSSPTSEAPTSLPTSGAPTSLRPTTGLPTSQQPTSSPTSQPTTVLPTSLRPTTNAPVPTKQPTAKPSRRPSTKMPTKRPTAKPSTRN